MNTPRFMTLFISSIGLSACAHLAPHNPPPALSESLPYPSPSRDEEFEQLAVQVRKLEQKIAQLQTRVQQLERRPNTPSTPKTAPRKNTQQTVQYTPPNATNHNDKIIRLQQAQEQYKNKQYQKVTQTLHGADGGGNGKENDREAMLLLLKSHQQLNNCQSVIQIGQRYAQRFSSSPTAPEALFAVGQCQWQIQQQDIARETWRQLIRTYPNTLSALKATQQLKK